MRTICSFALALFVALSAAQLSAAVSLNASGGGLGSVGLYEGPVTYSNFDFSGSLTFDGTIVTKSFESAAPINFAVQYASSDLDFTGTYGGGFRWSESVTNNTSSPVTSLLLELDPNSSATFLDINTTPPSATKIVPTYAIITPGAPPSVTRDTSFPGGFSLSGDGKQLVFFFNTPLAPSQQVQIHVPINNLDGTTSFGLTQRLTAVPEPLSIVTWGALMAVGSVVLYRRRYSLVA